MFEASCEEVAIQPEALMRFAPSERLSVQMLTDAPGRSETPAMPHPRVSIHAGRSVYLACERAGLKQRGLRVYGDMEIIPAETACVWEPNGPDTALILGLDQHLLTAIGEDLGVHADRLELLNRFQARDLQIEHIGWALQAEMEAGYPSGRVFRDSLAAALAAALIRRHSVHGSRGAKQVKDGLTGKRRRQAIAFIEDHLDQDLTLSSIAAAAGLSVSHLKATFRRSVGLPVHRYVIRRRVERARSLIVEGKLSISEVAAATGFAHQSHLAMHMRNLLGISPGDLRRA